MTLPRAAETEVRHRAGYVAIAGRPNVGKSTLLNRLIGSKVSITSSRPQTTRQRITGIVTRPDAQIVFVDTPGYQTKHRSALNRLMNRAVADSLQEADAIVWVVEALKFDREDESVARLLPPDVPVVLAINKIDLVRDKKQLLPFMDRLAGRREFAAIVPVSAHKQLQVKDLIDALVSVLPEGPQLFDEDEITTASERFLAGELLREKLVRGLGEELPYATTVRIEEFKIVGSVRHIHGVILVDKASQKGIVIGKNGQKLKELATQARQDMERLFGGRVFLEVWVRVKRGWGRTEADLRRAGYED
ncbi:MAG: GTPase Era [Burkholderiales bacterium]